MDGIDVAGFLQAAGAASLAAKMMVDGIKMALDLPRWGPTLLAFLGAQGFEFLLLLSQGATFNKQVTAQAVIIGFFAWGIAIGATALQTRGDKVNQKIDEALKSDPGTTRTEIDAAVVGK